MRIAPAIRENAKEFDTVFAITEAVMGFVPNSMLIMARDPELLAAFAELSAVIVVRPGQLDPGLKALIMYMVSCPAECQYCATTTRYWRWSRLSRCLVFSIAGMTLWLLRWKKDLGTLQSAI